MHRLRAISILFALAPLFAGVAAADEKKPAASKPAPVSNQPETTTATFGQWTLRCVRRADVNNNQKICEIDAAVAPQNQPNTVFRIGVAHPLGEDKAQLRITVAVPPIVFIPTAPVIKAKPDEPGVHLAAMLRRRLFCRSGGATGRNRSLACGRGGYRSHPVFADAEPQYRRAILLARLCPGARCARQGEALSRSLRGCWKRGRALRGCGQTTMAMSEAGDIRIKQGPMRRSSGLHRSCLQNPAGLGDQRGN